METLAKADVFFVITGGAVVLVTIVILVALFYVIKILRDVEDITEHVKEEGNAIIGDIKYVRTSVKNGGKKLKSFINPTSEKKKSTKSKK